MFQTESNPMPNDSLTYVDYQTSMVRLAKQIARTSQDMVGSGLLLTLQPLLPCRDQAGWWADSMKKYD